MLMSVSKHSNGMQQSQMLQSHKNINSSRNIKANHKNLSRTVYK